MAAPDSATRIVKVCTPCDLFVSKALQCRAVAMAGELFLRIFQGKACDPRRFLIAYLRRRLRGHDGDRAEDLASDVIARIVEAPPQPPLPSPDLIGLQRFLAGRAIQAKVDEDRRRHGRYRCGNCRYLRVLRGNVRQCHHPSPDHPWQGKELLGSTDPRGLQPPCTTFFSTRTTDGADDALDRQAATTKSPAQAALEHDQDRMLLDAFLVVQRHDPRIALVLHLSFFRGRENARIAGELGSSVKTVIRYKKKGLALLRAELERRGVVAFEG